MASQQTVNELLNYYVGLLIIQYANQPKAMATINLLAAALMANGVYLDVLNGYNITGDNTAIGTQLDIIGKYVGVNRNFPELILENYSAMITADDVASPPSSPPAFGFSTAATISDYEYNGTLICEDIIATNEQLTDASFLTLIHLAIIQNNMNYSMGSVDALLFEFFGLDLRAEYPSAMHWVFFISGSLTSLLQAIIYKNLLPVPIGVGALVVTEISGLVFSLITCENIADDFVSPFGYGFSTCADYDSLNGQTLLCSQISTLT